MAVTSKRTLPADAGASLVFQGESRRIGSNAFPRARKLSEAVNRSWTNRLTERLIQIVKFHDPRLQG
jgi:hypothetical protein